MITVISSIAFIFAWFVFNQNAKGKGINIDTASDQITGGFLNRYLAVGTENEGVYKLGSDIDKNDITLNPYDDLNDYDLVIYELGATVNKNSYSLTLCNFDTTVNDDIVYNSKSDSYQNYLSNVASFSYLEKSYDANGNAIFTKVAFPDTTTSKSLKYISNRDSVLTSEDILSDIEVASGTEVVIYLLFSYNGDSMNKLWSANIGTNATQIFFKEDIEFRIK